MAESRRPRDVALEGLRRLRARVRLRTRLSELARRPGPTRDEPPPGSDSYLSWTERYDRVGNDDEPAMRRLDASLDSRPVVSLLLSVEGARPSSLDSLVESLAHQIYGEWELVCVCPGEASPARDAVARAAEREPRIRLVTAEAEDAAQRPLGVALAEAGGELGVIVEASTRLRPHALLLLAHASNADPAPVLVYADEDRLDADGRRCDHWFKPDWNPALLLATNYVGALAAFRLEEARARGLPSSATGDEAWALLLRLTRGTEPTQIVHLPHVLVHRATGEPAAVATGGRDVVAAHLASSGVDATVETVGSLGVRVVYALPRVAPRIRLVVATGCLHDSVGPCLESVLRRTDYPNLALSIVVDERTERDAVAHELLQRLAGDARVSVMTYPSRPFSYAWVHNWAIEQVEEELLCLVNDDVSVIAPRWLELMVGHLLQPGVGAVGARLLYPDGTVQHGGVILGAGVVAGHYHHGLAGTSPGYHGRAILDQDLSCVTAACMAVRRTAFLEAGGFDERFAIAFNDVDLCIRLREAGWRIVFAGGAELFHGESTSVGQPDSESRRDTFAAERRLMQERWESTLSSDPSFNPNLDLGQPGCGLAFPPRVAYPWRPTASSERGGRVS